ncbi:MAG: hypothetical protein KJN60_05215 [Boseongicola sp.]|nr:hypothetical protein [Boseongicola sp.]
MLFSATRLADRTFRRENPSPPERDPERLGHATAERPKGCLLWLHVNDPADAGSISALTKELSTLRDEPVLGLVTSPGNASPFSAPEDTLIHQLVPGDTRGSVQRFLQHWTPDVAVFAGQANRAVLLSETHAAGIPMFLAASTPNSTKQIQEKFSAGSISVSDLFSGIVVASIADQMELIGMGVPEKRTAVAGPLSDIALPPSSDEDEFTAISSAIGGRPVWLAADVATSEVPILEAAQRRTTRAAHRILLVIVPRDREDGLAIAGSLETHGWRTALRSDGGPPDESVQVFIADTDEDIGIWYRLSPITYLGGSFDADLTISDPFGPTALGSAVLHGPEVSGAVPRIQRLQAAEASLLVAQPEDLGDAVFKLLSPDQAAKLAHAGWATTSEGAPAIEALVNMISLTLDGEEPS